MITLSSDFSIGVDLFPVAEKHQQALIDTLTHQQLPLWQAVPFFVSASIHKSLDGTRVFVYSQWEKPYLPTSSALAPALAAFYSPDRSALEVFVSRAAQVPIKIEVGDKVTHLAEFRMLPTQQKEMIALATTEIDRAGAGKQGLLSATFHRSVDGTRVFNYGQWESEKAFQAILKKEGFNPDTPYWAGIAKNEFHLYQVVAQFAKQV
ncbi:MAG: antibiotic biosynthesis monooxygenase family protein [Thermonemataceae bacterium]